VSQLAVVPELDEELDRLFALPPAEFTAARNDLVGRLKKANQAEAAARVQGLRKPTIPIWALNQVARQHQDDVELLTKASDELRAAQQASIADGDRERLRAATAAERDALKQVTQRASALLEAAQQKPTPAVLERVSGTARSAAIDPRGRELLAAGMLVEELESSGFAAFEGMRIPARRKTGTRSGPPPPPSGAELRRRKERIRKLRERARKLVAAAADADREAERAEAEATRERRKADKAQSAADQATQELEAAEAEDLE
jgi:hypothetical protein